MKVTVSKEGSPAAFSVEATGIKTVGDVKEVIYQLRLIEGQLTDGKLGSSFKIKEDLINTVVGSSNINSIRESSITRAVRPTVSVFYADTMISAEHVYLKGHFVPTTNNLKASGTIKASGISTLAKDITLNGSVTFSLLNVAPPFSLAFTNPSTGERLSELKEKDGVLTFEGKADEAVTISLMN